MRSPTKKSGFQLLRISNGSENKCDRYQKNQVFNCCALVTVLKIEAIANKKIRCLTVAH
ncbi:hypothetical protein [Crocosphaera sp.]|uniref:hypothetical protein n=1 Tax=Crocosphaera sp. TaxID=2729996 RepID=UPI00263814F4|nr:hypothetical protein [Crocosphaera sp.]MDJ0579518.1 hypothetical protein [Crocosphaera sp.]